MTYKIYKEFWGDGYCSLNDLASYEAESEPEEFKLILEDWKKAHLRALEELEEEYGINKNPSR